MAARTVEEKFHQMMEIVWIGAKLLADGNDCVPAETRIDSLIACLEEARELNQKVEKKRALADRHDEAAELGRALDEMYVGLGDIDGS